MMSNLEDRWKTFEQVIEEREGVARVCEDCKKVKKGLYWGSIWLCSKCIDESTIEGAIEGDELVPRFSKRCQEIMKKHLAPQEASPSLPFVPDEPNDLHPLKQ